jgi:hypothetical protein
LAALKQKELEETRQLMRLRSETVVHYEGLVKDMQARIDEYASASESGAVPLAIPSVHEGETANEARSETQEEGLGRSKYVAMNLLY